MVNPILEEAMELTICRSLNDQGWIWNEGDNDKGFDPELGLFPEDVLHWLKTQHPKEYERAIPPTANDTDRRSRERRLLNRLTKELDYTPILDGITKKVNGGLLGTLRDGFSFTQADLGTVNFPDMAGFFPYDPAKTEVTKKAKENRLRVLQQVHFEKGDGSRIDLVLLVNGIPVVTMELKTDNTQSIADAVRQYKHDRKPNRSKRPLLNPGRCLVHFAVSSREVMMTTELNGADTVFLPFNQGTDEGRAGNPDNPNGYRVSYLWEWVCSPDLLLRILKDYALWEPSTKGNEGRLIFPRFHQLRSVERVTNDVAVNGTGRRYLIQHSAGSGKTKTIAWMAHRANKMIHEDGTKLFDCVIVVTDRTVLDKNVADGLSLLQASEGMVINITNDDTSKSEKLNHYLTQGKRILDAHSVSGAGMQGGDSGGPFFVDGKLAGLATAGTSNGDPDLPSPSAAITTLAGTADWIDGVTSGRDTESVLTAENTPAPPKTIQTSADHMWTYLAIACAGLVVAAAWSRIRNDRQ